MRRITAIGLCGILAACAGSDPAIRDAAGPQEVMPGGIDQSRGFEKIDPAWIRSVAHVVPTKDGESFAPVIQKRPDMETVIRAPRWHPDGECTIESYYRKAEDERAGVSCRSVWRDGGGHIFLETAGDEKAFFERGFYDDGTLNSYKRFERGGLVEAYSASPDGKVKVEAHAGRGTPMEWTRNGDYGEVAWWDGKPYAHQLFQKGVCAKTTLMVGNDQLEHEATKETLRTSQFEMWVKQGGGTADGAGDGFVH